MIEISEINNFSNKDWCDVYTVVYNEYSYDDAIDELFKHWNHLVTINIYI